MKSARVGIDLAYIRTFKFDGIIRYQIDIPESAIDNLKMPQRLTTSKKPLRYIEESDNVGEKTMRRRHQARAQCLA